MGPLGGTGPDLYVLEVSADDERLVDFGNRAAAHAVTGRYILKHDAIKINRIML